MVPHGVLIFFPSYRLMDASCERWRITNQWDKISQRKPIFVEPKGSNKSVFEEVMSDFNERIEEGGAVLLAVCRGKISEGVDFANESARAVITIGLPFPNCKSQEIKDKRNYNDRNCKERNLLNGQDWYNIQAFRAINQALGRCLRHIKDWGAIIMIESRIAGNAKYKKSISKWIRDELCTVSRWDEALDRIELFCNEKTESSHDDNGDAMSSEKNVEETTTNVTRDPSPEPTLAHHPSPEPMPGHHPYPIFCITDSESSESPNIPLFSKVDELNTPDSGLLYTKRVRKISESPSEDEQTDREQNVEVENVTAVHAVIHPELSPSSNKPSTNHISPDLFPADRDVENRLPVANDSEHNNSKRRRLSRLERSVQAQGTLSSAETLNRYYKCQNCKSQIIRTCVPLCCTPPCGNISIKGLIQGSYYINASKEATFSSTNKDRKNCSSLGNMMLFCSNCKINLGIVDFVFGPSYVGGAVTLNYF